MVKIQLTKHYDLSEANIQNIKDKLKKGLRKTKEKVGGFLKEAQKSLTPSTESSFQDDFSLPDKFKDHATLILFLTRISQLMAQRMVNLKYENIDVKDFDLDAPEPMFLINAEKELIIKDITRKHDFNQWELAKFEERRRELKRMKVPDETIEKIINEEMKAEKDRKGYGYSADELVRGVFSIMFKPFENEENKTELRVIYQVSFGKEHFNRLANEELILLSKTLKTLIQQFK
jgi:hypothetical protein